MIEDEIRAIIASLRSEDRAYIHGLSEDHLILLHRTFGRGLRNAFRANKYPHLFTYCHQLQTAETRSFDSISKTATKFIWERLRQVTNAA